jgi:sulfur-carrier protein
MYNATGSCLSRQVWVTASRLLQARYHPLGLKLDSGVFVANTQVEFFGVPRQRAGAAVLEVQAETFGQLLTNLVMRVPPLGALVDGDGRLHKSFAASLNGDRFISEPETRLANGDHVLILSADAGG